jgi:hypothetical protein
MKSILKTVRTKPRDAEVPRGDRFDRKSQFRTVHTFAVYSRGSGLTAFR